MHTMKKPQSWHARPTSRTTCARCSAAPLTRASKSTTGMPVVPASGTACSPSSVHGSGEWQAEAPAIGTGQCSRAGISQETYESGASKARQAGAGRLPLPWRPRVHPLEKGEDDRRTRRR